MVHEYIHKQTSLILEFDFFWGALYLYWSENRSCLLYSKSILSIKELKFLPLSKLTSLVSFLRNSVNSESLLSPALRAPAEWCGMAGLSLKDALKIYPQLVDVYPYWVNESNIRRKWDWFDFKTDILTTIAATELRMRKARNFANIIDANLILPFTNQVIAEYFGRNTRRVSF